MFGVLHSRWRYLFHSFETKILGNKTEWNGLSLNQHYSSIDLDLEVWLSFGSLKLPELSHAQDCLIHNFLPLSRKT